MSHFSLGVVGWDKFQHYSDRRPLWIKNYVDLLHRNEYLELSGHRRAILHGLWMEYAMSHGQLAHNTRMLSRQLALKITMRDLKALSDAGFLALVASVTSVGGASLEKEKESSTKGRTVSRREGQRPKLTISETINSSLKEAL